MSELISNFLKVTFRFDDYESQLKGFISHNEFEIKKNKAAIQNFQNALHYQQYGIDVLC